MYAAAGAMLANVIAGFVPIQAGGLAGIGIKFGIAYATGFVAERFVNPATAQMMAVGGAASAAGDLINYAFGMARGVTGSLVNPPAPPDGGDVGDIVLLPEEIERLQLGDVTESPSFAYN
jgi:hypothetical protein